MKRFLAIQPIYTFLLIIFFIFHGYTTNYNIVPFKDSLILIGVYFLVALGMIILFYFILKNINKSCLLTLFILAYQFFFGSLHDTLKELFPGSFITKYRFLLPSILISLIILIVYFYKRKNNFAWPTLYLNLLFLILISVDLITLVSISNNALLKNKTTEIRSTPCDTCSKPDIYLIVADGYSGKQQLKELFNFDNTNFENELRKRDFFVIDSSLSNYNFTPFSIASMLDMDYLTGIEGRNSSKNDMLICFNKIKNSKTLKLLEGMGYRIYNYSIFDLKDQPAFTKPTFIQNKTRPIISQTFLYRIRRDIGYHLVTTLKIKSVTKKWLETDLRNNKKVIDLTLRTSKTSDLKPMFIYTHIVMPHYPYYFDSIGNKTDYQFLTDEFNSNKENFVSYLKYANKEYLKLIDTLLLNTKGKSIILFLSDHGFREFYPPVQKKFHFLTLSSIYLPNKNYTDYYKGQSNINNFRLLFNNYFNLQYPIIKDSSSFLLE